MSMLLIFVEVLVFIFKDFNIIFGNGIIEIDPDHLRIEPECGKIPAIGSSRISNAEESDRHYPWVVLVSRENDFMEIKKGWICGGSIITKNAVVTAAHCICGPSHKKDFTAPKHIRDKIACKGGKRKTVLKPKVQGQLPNEITNDNKINVGGGDSNFQNLQYYEILFAYVHDEYEDNYLVRTTPVIDIGLLKTYENKGNNYQGGKNFYDTLTDHFIIGPICIVAEKEDLRKKGGNFETVGWGIRYSEEQEETTTTSPEPISATPNIEPIAFLADPKPNKHSCTTNQDGPMKYIYKHCSVAYLKTQSWSCNMNDYNNFYRYLINQGKMDETLAITYMNNIRIDEQENTHYYPAGYDFKECNKLWNDADDTMRRLEQDIDLLEMWKEVKQIEIYGHSDEPRSKLAKLLDQPPQRNDRGLEKIKTCYKDALFQELGWCYTEGDIYDKGWGFCDSSCDIMPYRENPIELKQKSLPNVYHKMNWKVDSSEVIDNYCLPARERAQWQLCLKSTIPMITIAQFEMKEDGTVKHSENTKREIPDGPPALPHIKSGWQQFCEGDSGGGHWTFNSKEKRATLVGVSCQISGDWCGSPSVIEKMTHPSIQNWVKMHAGILPQASSST